jgi:hypothetical protein
MYFVFADINDILRRKWCALVLILSPLVIFVRISLISAKTKCMQRPEFGSGKRCVNGGQKEVAEWVCLKYGIDVHWGCGDGEIILMDVIS